MLPWILLLGLRISPPAKKRKKENQGAHPYNTAQVRSHALKYLVDAKPGECG